jgi:tRNA A37 threonylcarbamoyladenosine biosynthesis protein TsaE
MSEIEGLELKDSPKKTLERMKSFLGDDSHRVFILKGYAGTGKTTLIRFFIKYLSSIKKQYFLLASTGRAAKVLSNLTHSNAQTIHSMIYKFVDLNNDYSEVEEEPDGQLFLSLAISLSAKFNHYGISNQHIRYISE